MIADCSKSRWADGPYEPIVPPSSYLDINAHFAVNMATEMAFVHNCMLRAFNAILLQGPHISSDPSKSTYNPADISDFLLFTDCLIRTIWHHHDTEERVGFKGIEDAIGKPGFMDQAGQEHEVFHDGMIRLQKYAEELQKPDRVREWNWDGQGGMKEIIDSFLDDFVLHLRAEVELLLTIRAFTEPGVEDRLREAWKSTEEEAQKVGIAGFYDVFPIVYSCHDRTWKGGEAFPPVPKAFNYAVYYWFSRRYHGAWRFAPCDLWSRPQELKVAPAE